MSAMSARWSGAAALGNVLFVGVVCSDAVRQRSLKGAGRPVISAAERARVVAALGCATHVFAFERRDSTLCALSRSDRMCSPSEWDYQPDQVVGHEIVEPYGGRVVVLGKVDEVSTTAILARSRESKERPGCDIDRHSAKGAGFKAETSQKD